MVEIGTKANINVIAVLSNMDQPLGKNIGNALEVQEVIEVLSGSGPEDLKQLAITLASHMVSISQKIAYKTALKKVIAVLDSGQALNKFYEMVKYQNGQIEKLNIKTKYEYKILSDKEGYITKIDTEQIGKISCLLGAGRIKKDDSIDYSAGIIINKKINDYVLKGDLLATLYTNKNIDLTDTYLKAITITEDKIASKLILGVIKCNN